MPAKRSKSRKSRAPASPTTSLETVTEAGEPAKAVSAEEQSEEDAEPVVSQQQRQKKQGKLKAVHRETSTGAGLIREKSTDSVASGDSKNRSLGAKGGKLSPLTPAKKKKSHNKGKLQGTARVVGIAELMLGPETGSFDNILQALGTRQGDWLPALSDTQILELTGKVQVQTFKKNDIIYDESQHGEKAMHFFVLLDGYVKGSIQKGKETQKLFTTRTFGATFGDRSLVGGCPRPHILTAKTKVIAGKVSKENYINLFRGDNVAFERVRNIAMSTTTKAGRMRKGLLLEVMTQSELLTIADESWLLWFRERETIIQQGDSLDTMGPIAKQMYMLESGTAVVTVRVQDPITDEISEKRVDTLDQSGTLFGESSLMYGTKRSATVTAMTDCRVCAIPHQTLDTILDSRPDVRKKFVDLITARKVGYTTATAGFLIVDPVRKKPNEPVRADEAVEVGRTSSSDAEIKQLRKRAAILIKTKGDEQMTNIMALFDAVARSGDWNKYHPEIQRALQSAEEQFGILEGEYAAELPLDGLDMKKLLEKLQRLEYLRSRANAWMPILPEMEEDEFRAFSCQRLTNTVSQYKATPHKLRAHGFTIDWRSLKDVCGFMEKLPEIINNSIAGIPRFHGFLEVKYGEIMAARLHKDVLVWYERKQAAWEVLHELHSQRVHKKHDLQQALARAKAGEGSEQEQMHGFQMRRALEELEGMESRINSDLESLNQAVVRSSFAFVSPPPNRALIDSPLLAYALHLQRILELKEDFRYGRAVTTQHAQLAMSTLIRESTLHTVREKNKKVNIDEYVPPHKDGTRKIAPIVKDFMGELGSWLFTTDTKRWDRQARLAGQLTGLPRIESAGAP